MTEPYKPITERRLQRMAAVLARRQPGMAVVLEDVHDPHNVSAVLRSCDATGVSDVHLVYSVDEAPELSTGVAAGTQRWLTVTQHESIDDCYAVLRAQNKSILATALAGEPEDLHTVDLTVDTALVFGNESRGLSEAAIEGADRTVRIAMMGMAESLNISVACGVVLFEAMRQRRNAELFDAPGQDLESMQATLEAWLERDVRDPDQARHARYDPTHFPLVWPRSKPMPKLDESNNSYQ